MSCKTTKEAYAVKRTVPPSAEIQANIDKLLSDGVVEDPSKMPPELARLGARLIIQRAVEDEFDQWLGRARYERRPEAGTGKRNGFRARRLQTGEGERRVEIPQVAHWCPRCAPPLAHQCERLVRRRTPLLVARRRSIVAFSETPACLAARDSGPLTVVLVQLFRDGLSAAPVDTLGRRAARRPRRRPAPRARWGAWTRAV